MKMSFVGRALSCWTGRNDVFRVGSVHATDISWIFSPIFGGNLRVEEFESDKETYEALDWIPLKKFEFSEA